MLAIAISLVASVCWGSTDFLSGLASRRTAVPIVVLGVEAVGLIIILAVALLTSEPLPATRWLVQAAAAGVLGVSGLALFFLALSLGKMSVVAPITSCGAAIPAIVGVATGDPFTGLLAAGLVAALAGIVLVSLEAEHEGETHPDRSGRLPLVLAGLAAIGFGGYYVLFDAVADHSIVWGLVAARGVPVLALIAIVVARHAAPPQGSARGLVLGAGVLDILATSLYGIALTRGSLSAVSVVGALFPLTTVILARVVLGERVRPIQRVGIVLALGGVALIAAA